MTHSSAIKVLLKWYTSSSFV